MAEKEFAGIQDLTNTQNLQAAGSRDGHLKAVHFRSTIMELPTEQVLLYLAEVEEAAEDILADKQQIVDLDVRRNSNREALNALRRDTEINDEDKIKVCFGSMFIKLPKKTTRQMIQKDQEQLDKEICDARQRLKVKVNHLNELQGKPELKGFSLSPLSRNEMKAINQVLKR